MCTPGHRAGPHLHPWGDVVDDADGFAVRVARQGVRDDVILHLPWGLCPRLHPIDGFAGGALQAPILRARKEGNTMKPASANSEPGWALRPPAALSTAFILNTAISQTLRKQGGGLGELATATQL